MPIKPKRPCNHPMCPELTTETYCEAHRKQYVREKDKDRPTASQRGYNARWRRARRMFLRRHPFCVHCEQEGKLTPATEVDHIVPHKGNYNLFWDENNWRALCKPCHSRKTAIEDGGFGRGGGLPISRRLL